MLRQLINGSFVMDRVIVDLENCYGIKKLAQEFDFRNDRVYAIYAPNGAMKSSLAQISCTTTVRTKRTSRATTSCAC
jgi:ABC-type multidrug transport system ATPase subunit